MKARYAAVFAWLLFVAACAVVVSRTSFSTDLSAFLPRSASPAQQVLVEQLRDGVVSRLILVGLDHAAPEALARTSKDLAAALRGEDAFVSVSNGEEAASTPDREFLWRNRYLLSPAMTPGHFSSSALRASLEDSVQLLGSPAALFVQKVLPNDPSGELLRLVEQLEGQTRPRVQHGVWFSADGTRALLLLQTRAAGYDIDAQEHALDLIRAAFASASRESRAAAPTHGDDRARRVFGSDTIAHQGGRVALFAHRDLAGRRDAARALSLGAGACARPRCPWRAARSPESPRSAWASARCTASRSASARR